VSSFSSGVTDLAQLVRTRMAVEAFAVRESEVKTLTTRLPKSRSWDDAGVVKMPGSVARAAEAFGLDTSVLQPLGGASGSSWDAGSRVLRIGRRARMDAELAAATAAAGLLPVPRVIGRSEVGGNSAVLLERLPGQPAADLARQRPQLAHAAGRACGGVYALLARVFPPAGVPPVHDAPSGLDGSDRACVLHLDLHPFNVLVGENAELTGVLDWANAAAGPPVLDRARSWAILTLDPAARARRDQPGWQALAGEWTEAAALRHMPAVARAWACRFMLTDLARRYPLSDLRHVSEALARAEADTAAG
jgi:aminoglycoside phosphotransferase (APT) family kinase protein